MEISDAHFKVVCNLDYNTCLNQAWKIFSLEREFKA